MGRVNLEKMSQSDFKSLEWPFKDPKFIFFTDFDGTITLQDSNDYMTDTIGFGKEIREGLNRDILDGKITFRDAFRQMMDSVKKPVRARSSRKREAGRSSIMMTVASVTTSL